MNESRDSRLAIGVPGLEEVLYGGLIPRRTYLARGGPGTGKTTLGLHFLRAGPLEEGFLVSLGESESEVRENAARVNLPLDGLPILNLSPMADDAAAQETYTLLESWEVEGPTLHDRILDYARRHQPRRVFIDSISTLRYLTPDTFQFRRQVLSLMREFEANGATVLFTAQTATEVSDDDLLSLSDGVLQFEHVPGGRICRVIKIRGSGFIEGNHHYELTDEGMVVFPRLVPGEHRRSVAPESISSGVPGLDALTHGGIERGTVTIVSGPTGVGKTSLATHFMKEAAARGECSVLYSFDERFGTFAERSEALDLPVREMIAQQDLVFEEIDPLRYNPDEFAVNVRRQVEDRDARIVMLDSLSGYRRAIRGEDLVDHIHALCRYLVNMGVTAIVINEVSTIAGDDFQATEYGISYLADSILVLRYMEKHGEIRKSIGVLKKRTGGFERTLRELDFSDAGLTTGPPLVNVRGILKGMPEFTADDRPPETE